MTLDDIALCVLIVIAALVFYGVVAVYGVSLRITKVRQHPHGDAIGAATRFRLLTLGVLRRKSWLSYMV